MVNLLFSFHGRIDRARYWLGSFLVGFIGFAALATLSVAAGVSPRNETEAMHAPAVFGLALLPLMALMAWCGLALQVKRFHDRGRTGWLTLLPLAAIVPIVITVVSAAAAGASYAAAAASAQPLVLLLWLINLAFFIDLGCLSSKDGPNKYGDGPPRSAPPAPMRVAAPSAETPAASSFLGAHAALERAIAERTSAPAMQQPTTPQPARGAASFGRRATR